MVIIYYAVVYFKRVVFISFTVLESQSGNIARLIVDRLRDIRRLGGNTGALTYAHKSAMEGGAISDLLVLSTNFRRAAEERPRVKCRILLVPGNYELPSFVEAPCVVSYGMSTRDSITLSSIDENGVVLSLQRELPTVLGNVLVRQDIPARIQKGAIPEERLACGAALLLLGVRPELL